MNELKLKKKQCHLGDLFSLLSIDSHISGPIAKIQYYCVTKMLLTAVCRIMNQNTFAVHYNNQISNYHN